jgi:hypothetical protein
VIRINDWWATCPNLSLPQTAHSSHAVWTEKWQPVSSHCLWWLFAPDSTSPCVFPCAQYLFARVGYLGSCRSRARHTDLHRICDATEETSSERKHSILNTSLALRRLVTYPHPRKPPHGHTQKIGVRCGDCKGCSPQRRTIAFPSHVLGNH